MQWIVSHQFSLVLLVAWQRVDKYESDIPQALASLDSLTLYLFNLLDMCILSMSLLTEKLVSLVQTVETHEGTV